MGKGFEGNGLSQTELLSCNFTAEIEENHKVSQSG
jgi:hypothetical protein